jgi:hypothetical protein
VGCCEAGVQFQQFEWIISEKCSCILISGRSFQDLNWVRQVEQKSTTVTLNHTFLISNRHCPSLFSDLLSLSLASQLNATGSSLEKEITELSLIHTSKFDATGCSP